MRTSGSSRSKKPPDTSAGETHSISPETWGTSSLSVRGSTVPWLWTT